MKTVDKIFGWILVVMGCVHCGASVIAYRNFGFFTAGIAFLAAGLLNIIRSQSEKGGLPRIGSIAVNVLLTLACVWIVLTRGVPSLHGPSVIVVMIAIVVELIFSVQG